MLNEFNHLSFFNLEKLLSYQLLLLFFNQNNYINKNIYRLEILLEFIA